MQLRTVICLGRPRASHGSLMLRLRVAVPHKSTMPQVNAKGGTVKVYRATLSVNRATVAGAFLVYAANNFLLHHQAIGEHREPP